MTAADRAGKPTLGERFPALRALRLSGRRRRLPFVQQTAATDCGAACLATVLGYHGKEVGLPAVREATGVDRRGTDALALIEAGRRFGLIGRGVRLERHDDLALLDRGAVLHWRFSHFVVLDRFRAGGAWVVDPAVGRRFLTRAELATGFTGVALVFEPGAEFERGGVERSRWRHLRRALGQSGLLGRILAVSLMIQGLALSIPILTGLVVDRVVPRGDVRLLTVLAVGVAGVIGFQLLAALVRSFLLLHLRTRLDARLAVEFLDHLVDLPYPFFQQRSVGDLGMRLHSNSTIRELLTSAVLSGLLDGLMVGVYLILLLLLHTGIGLLAAALGALQVGIFALVRRRQRELMSRALQAQAQTRGYEYQLLAGIETLKAAGAEHQAARRWSDLLVRELNAALDRGRLEAAVGAALEALATASPLLVLLYGAVLVIRDELTLGAMLALSALAVGFLTPLRSLVNSALSLQLMGSYLERIEDVLETPREQADGPRRRSEGLGGRVAAEEVSFRYGPNAPPAVADVSFELAPGSLLAVVGASGSGKSTLAGLLAGLYAPQTGRIRYDGADLRDLDLAWLRRRIGFVPQHPFLFALSIRANLALTDPGLPLSRLREAARLAGIDEEIEDLPMGYDTVLADYGASLSGGQRQRLALARALVVRPRVVILDEATSALDAVTERRVLSNLAALTATRVIIAHRLSTVRDADQILVLDRGRIAERGRHDQLLRAHGLYRRLVGAQLAAEPDEPGVG